MTFRVKSGPFSEEVTWEIAAFEKNKLVKFEAVSALGKSQVSYLFKKVGDSTELTGKVSIQLKGMYRYIRPLAQFLHKRNRRGYLVKTKRILENSLESKDDSSS